MCLVSLGVLHNDLGTFAVRFFRPVRDLPPPGVYFTKAAFEKYSCLRQIQQVQAHDGLPPLPVLGSHLPENIPPLPQPDEETESSSEEESENEPSESSASDATPSAEEEELGQPDEQGADSLPDAAALEEGLHDEQDVEELSEEEEQLQRTSESEELLSEKKAEEGNSEEPVGGPTADITSEDLWGSDSSADEMDAEHQPTFPPNSAPAGKVQNIIHGNTASPELQKVFRVATDRAEGDGEEQQHASKNRQPEKRIQQPGVHPEQPGDGGPRGKRKPAQPVAQRVGRIAQPAKPAKKPDERAREPGEAGKGARQPKRKAAAEAAAPAEVEPMSEVAAANAEIMRAFGGFSRSRAAFGGAPKKAQPTAERALKAPMLVPAERQQQSRRAPQQRAAGLAAASEASGRADVAADVTAESPAEAHKVPAQRLSPEQEEALQDERILEAAEVSAEAIHKGMRHATETLQLAVRAEPIEPEAAGMEGTQQTGRPAPGPGGASSAPASGQPLSADTAKATALAKAAAMCDLLNPNNPLYDPAFALEYAQIRGAAVKAEGKGYKKKGPRQIWSKLVARDHAWYLQNQGRALIGKEAERLAELGRRVSEEQQLFLKSMWTVPADAPLTYNYIDPRADAQLKAHMAVKREAVRQLPRLWSLKRLLGLAEVRPQKTEPAMVHLSTAHASGSPAVFTPHPGNLHINLDHPYLRQSNEQSSAEAAAGSTGDAGWHQLPKQALHEDATALGLAAEKGAAAVMTASAFSALARTFPPAQSPGWEVPVDIVPLQPNLSSSGAGAAEGKPGRTVACFGKVLVPRQLPRREQLELLYRHAILTHGLEPALAASPKQAQRGPEKDGLQMGAEEALGGVNIAGEASGAMEGVVQALSAAAAVEADAMSEGGLSAELEAELAAELADLSDNSARSARMSENDRAPALDAPNAVPASSQTRYDLWRLGPFRIISRSSVRAAILPAGANAEAMPVAVAAKMEYHGEKLEDAEELTGEELCRWWSHTFIRPGSTLQVGHVGVRNSKLLRTESFTARGLQDYAAAAGFSPSFLWCLLQELLRMLGTLRPGRYLLTHAPGSGRICLFAALPDDPATQQVKAQPLPCDTGAAAPGAVYDLWAAHTNSGAADESQVSFVPKRWRPSHADVPQIPYTFALKAPAPAAAGGGRGRGRGGRSAEGGREGGGRKRQRHRKLMPSAWTIGQRPDWDEVPQGNTGGDSGKGFSAADYAQQLGEDLG
ncbi:probable little elongation complex subunit 2 at C-terminar half [Coccomyxa sp. Obi]|nr:probable little elongation complex subunit 2 at C-terminar half [Coccomyxa sp. Obi]